METLATTVEREIEEVLDQFRELIRHESQREGVNLEAVLKEAGIARSSFYRFQSGRVERTSFLLIARICAAFGYRMELDTIEKVPA